jgi:hypothetical protein
VELEHEADGRGAILGQVAEPFQLLAVHPDRA